MSRFDFDRESPYGQDEFIGMVKAEALQGNARLDHPYVKLLVDGKLSREQLIDFAKQDYQLKKVPSWWSAQRITNCLTIADQKAISKAFSEEMGGADDRFTGHQAMYLKFGAALGLTPADLEHAPVLPSTILAVTMLMHINKYRSTPEGLASGSVLGEQTNVRVSQMFVPAFEKHYGLPRAGLEWFLEHIEADTEHGGMGEAFVKRYAKSKDMQNKIWDTIIRTKSAWWVFFDGLYSAQITGVNLPRYTVGKDLPEFFPNEPY